MKLNAEISPCGTFRYWLEREWDERPKQVFVMLNPSIADASIDDPTVRRCIHFSKREGAGGLIVVNLFAYRATQPSELNKAPNIVGPQNRSYINKALSLAYEGGRAPICGWGSNPLAITPGNILVARSMNDFGMVPQCLGRTKSGGPKHPLYLSGQTPIQEFKGYRDA